MSMPPRSRTGSGHLIAAAIIVVAILVALVALAAAGITPQRAFDSFFPVGNQTPVTDRSHDVKTLYDIVFVIAAAIFFVVEGAIIVTAFRYRRRPGDDDLPPQTHGNNLVEVIWTAIPTVIVLFLFVVSWQTLNTVEASVPTQVHIRAVAARFQWSFDYLDDKGNLLFTQLAPVGEDGGMVVPVGEPVNVVLRSKDVIHAFYVPKFLFKRDVIPGKENTFDFTVDEAGTYRGQCAELCGAFHGSMIFEVHALAKPDFDAWVQQQIQKASASPPSGGGPSGAPPSGGPSGAPPPSGGPSAAPGSPAAGSTTVELEAEGIAFKETTLTAPAGALTIDFKNNDSSVPHDVAIKDAGGNQVFKGDAITGPAQVQYQVPPLAAGTYQFMCTIHPNMTGTLTIQ